MRRSVGPFVIVLACLGALWWWKTHGEKADAPATGSAAIATGSAVATPAPATKKPPAHATRISAEERKQLDQRLEAAQRARATAPHAAPKPPSLPAGSDGSGTNDLDHIATNVLDALKEAIPFLADCYKANAPASAKHGLTVRAAMTLTTDPDIGTVIDADQIFDDNHQPLDRKLDDCLRNTMQTLQLPPLEDGQTAKVEYSFRFEDDAK
jgi:hypothetical protein